MLLTITTTHSPATDLGFLLAKHPARLNRFEVPFGIANVFFPEAGDSRCTAALLLDIDPIGLVRGKQSEHTLAEYVNDRPYTANSIMAVAIARVFNSALGGRCKERPELVQTPIPLEARIPTLPSRHAKDFISHLFAPLGYAIECRRLPLDAQFPEWGDGAVYDLTLRATCKLSDLLTHLYVLIPVLDNAKHYYISRDEIDKLLAHGEGWLNAHPAREAIVRRYLKRSRPLFNEAIDRLFAADDAPDDGSFDGEISGDSDAETDAATDAEVRGELEAKIIANRKAEKVRLNDVRLRTVMDELRELRAESVLDLGCGEAKLIQRLLADHRFTRIVGVDVSWHVIERAKRKLDWERLPDRFKGRVDIFQGALTYRDERFADFDAACLVEVIEHLDESRLVALERVVFECARPGSVIVTTPNADFNVNYQTLDAGDFRHSDHRFEWGRERFREWAEGVAQRHGYRVSFRAVGEEVGGTGSPTQMGVFSR